MAGRRRTARRGGAYRAGRNLTEFALGAIQVVGGAVLQLVSEVAMGAFRVARRSLRRPTAHPRPGAAPPSAKTPSGPSAPEDVVRPMLGGAVARIRFADVAGLERAKQEILLRTILPLRHPAQRERYGLTTGGGILLWGPPGCGKTLLASATAAELEAAFFHARASDLMSQRVGQAERNVAALFARVRSEHRAVLVLDEIDALCPSRRRSRSTIMARVISEFFSQTDGIERKTLAGRDDGFFLLIGATNWPESLDESLMRPGRLDVQVYVELPDYRARLEILRRVLARRAICTDVSLDELATATEGFSGADVVELVESTARGAFLTAIYQEGSPPALSRDLFRRTLESVVPSVSADELRRYEEFLRRTTVRRTRTDVSPRPAITLD